MTSTSICHYCGVSFVPKKGSMGKFCSSSCSAKFNNKGRVRTQESRLKISQKIKSLIKTGKLKSPPKKYGEDHPSWKGGSKTRVNLVCSMCNNLLSGNQKKFCETCNTKYKPTKEHLNKVVIKHQCVICTATIDTKRLTCSDICLKERHKQNSANNLRKNRHKYQGPHTRSWMEKSFAEWLESHNINKGIYGYLEQVHFKHRVDGRTKNGWADFVFVSRKLVIELDGSHHQLRKDLDDIRDAHLSHKKGYTVIRITHREYQRQTRLAEIEKLLGI
jgi:very-short-patch-repair endonuclease